MSGVILKQLPSAVTSAESQQSAKEQASWSPYNVNEGSEHSSRHGEPRSAQQRTAAAALSHRSLLLSASLPCPALSVLRWPLPVLTTPWSAATRA